MYFENNFWLQLLKSLIEFANDMEEMTILAKRKRKCIFSRDGIHAGFSQLKVTRRYPSYFVILFIYSFIYFIQLLTM